MAADEAHAEFDFAAHEQATVTAYLRKQPFYQDLANTIGRVLEECLRARDIGVHSVQHRAKDPASLGRKATIPSEGDPNSPKYSDPMAQITDLAGVRIITHFPNTLSEIDRLLHAEFEVVEKSDKGKELLAEDKFGYQSIHYLVRIRPERLKLSEYARFSGAVAEVQVRTILQHAWAEIEHDIQYKSSTTIPAEIRRRFMALAGILEVADREFQAIQDADRDLTAQAQNSVRSGNLEGVEITSAALKSYLDKKLGPDGRISDWSYEWTARLLKSLGFRDLKQVEQATAGYNDDRVSNVVMGARQGQTTRLELMLLAALGERFVERHAWRQDRWFVDRSRKWLERLRAAKIPVGIYDPLSFDSQPAEPSGLIERAKAEP